MSSIVSTGPTAISGGGGRGVVENHRGELGLLLVRPQPEVDQAVQ
jgi:hypothetical protein